MAGAGSRKRARPLVQCPLFDRLDELIGDFRIFENLRQEVWINSSILDLFG